MDVPRGKRPTAGDRLTNMARTGAGLGMLGGTRMAKGVSRGARQQVSSSVTPFVKVFHGDDPDVLRPSAALVYWIGAAEPSNGADYDFWYTANV